ncbi:AAA ATPase central domain-containing protein [Streptomyces clavuligerus]|nr:ATP-binding protein [Streptomyces clavuligerus]EDY51435.1 AAA ATPase central domain-containing protein [Streptomyces clavuligerus]
MPGLPPLGARLGSLVDRFGLSGFDGWILLAGLAPDVDGRFEALYGYLNDDVGRRRATVSLALELLGTGPWEPVARARFHPDAPLIAGGLLTLEDEERPLPGRAVRVPERVIAHLLGDERLDALLSDAGVEWLPATAGSSPSGTDGQNAKQDTGQDTGQDTERDTGHETAARIAAYRRPVRVHLRDKGDGDGADAVTGALRAAGRSVLRFRPRGDDKDAGVARALVREARLRGAGTALVVEPLPKEPGPLVRTLTEQQDVTVVLAGPVAYDPGWAPRSVVIPVEDVSAGADPLSVWRAELPDYAGDLATAVGAYRAGGERVRRAARAAVTLADFEGVPVGPGHVRRSARLLSAPLLGRFARCVRPAVGFTDLVLPGEPLGMLGELVGRARHRDRVLGEWRLRTGGGRGRGVVALFAGDSGTGKTLAAEVVAGELGLDLYVIDLSSVVDKYVGETEKNLERIFAEIDRTDVVLLFDEADAVFGKRSEVRSSHDRYANLESAFLLQRLESFDGIAILTTNLRANIDEAFTRRLDMVVDFPFPDPEARLRLWRSSLAGAPREPGLDDGLAAFAKEFELAGGSIRAGAATAAYLAAARGGAVTSDDVRAGARREYLKSGRLVPGTGWGP